MLQILTIRHSTSNDSSSQFLQGGWCYKATHLWGTATKCCCNLLQLPACARGMCLDALQCECEFLATSPREPILPLLRWSPLLDLPISLPPPSYWSKLAAMKPESICPEPVGLRADDKPRQEGPRTLSPWFLLPLGVGRTASIAHKRKLYCSPYLCMMRRKERSKVPRHKQTMAHPPVVSDCNETSGRNGGQPWAGILPTSFMLMET